MVDYTVEREREYQNEVIKLFREKLGYEYIGNLQYAKGATTNSKGEENAPIIEGKLRAFLESTGKYTERQIDGAIHHLITNSRLPNNKPHSLMDTNNSVYEILISGVGVSPNDTEFERDVMFFDFDNLKNNHFAIAEEVSYIDPITGKHARPDIVVYINGIAICIIELKRCFVSLEEAIRQHLSNERDIIPSFFTTTQFTVAARHAEHKKIGGGDSIKDEFYGFKYATIDSPSRFWCPWKEDTNETGIVLSDTESYERFFDKENLMFLFRYGVLSDGGVKKVMRPHQYHALRAAEPRLCKKASGVIWHSQGSGKSLTMVWLASYIKANFENPRVIVITDRTELDVQLSCDFTETGNNLHRATSQEDLLKTLNSGTEWLISTLIHKFGRHSSADDDAANDRTINVPLDKYLTELLAIVNDKSKYPNGFCVKGSNIFIFIDECHRTQGGRLHEAMKAIMGQEVMLIGFTGTPLLKEEKKDGYKALCKLSEIKFGPFIHKYLHKQAVEDKVILDLRYEARDVEQEITSPDNLNQKFEEIIKGLSDERKESIKNRWTTLEKVYSSKERIERIGYSILDDVENNAILRQDWANAILVADSVYTAYKYYEFFQNQRSILNGRIAIVTSYEPTDNDVRKGSSDNQKQTEEKFKHDMALKALEDAGVDNANKYEEWAKKKFITCPGQMKLIIVVDKLLTGFDAPCATFLYIDKYMRDHNLFQAICRVNRLGSDVEDKEGHIIPSLKEFGLIVDFNQLFGNIENAITRFNDENGGFGGLDPVDIEGLLEDSISKNKKCLQSALRAYNALKGVWASKNLTNNDQLVDYYTTDYPDDPAEARRKELYSVTSKLVSSYDNMADFMTRADYSTEETEKIEKLAHEAASTNLYIKQRSGDLFDQHVYDPDMRNLLDRYLRANEAEVIVKANADFSFLDLIDRNTNTDKIVDKLVQTAYGNSKAAAEIIEGKTRAVINNSKDSDPAFYKTFSERLQMTLDELRNSNANYKERLREILKIYTDAKNGGSDFPQELQTPLEKALWNNRRELPCFTDDDEQNIYTIQELNDMVLTEAGRDYRTLSSPHAAKFQARLKKRFPDLTKDELDQVFLIIIKN